MTNKLQATPAEDDTLSDLKQVSDFLTHMTNKSTLFLNKTD